MEQLFDSFSHGFVPPSSTNESRIFEYTKVDVPCGTDKQRTKKAFCFFANPQSQNWTFKVNFQCQIHPNLPTFFPMKNKRIGALFLVKTIFW